MSLEHSHGECDMVQSTVHCATWALKQRNYRIERDARVVRPRGTLTEFPGGYSEREPPDPISNSEVKTLRADDSVAAAMRE